jgi:GNAT superfamily N-acetyltransferase
MTMQLRTIQPTDVEPLVDLTIRAFEAIQHGIRDQLGADLFAPQNGDWRGDYQRTVSELSNAEHADRVIVAETDGRPLGFASWTTHPGPLGPQGEITLLAVDPDEQRQGVGRALIDAACDAMRQAGCVVAIVSTGGDRAHEPARAAYEAAGFTALPTVFYSRLLGAD